MAIPSSRKSPASISHDAAEPLSTMLTAAKPLFERWWSMLPAGLGKPRLHALARPRVVGAVDKDRGVSFGSSIASSAPRTSCPEPRTPGGAEPGPDSRRPSGEPLAVSTRASATCEPMQSPSGLAWPMTATDRPATVLSSPWNASENSGKNLPMARVGGRFGGQLVLNLVEGL